MRRADSEKSGGAEKKKEAGRGWIPCPAGGRAGRAAAQPARPAQPTRPPAIIGLRKVPPLYCEGATSYAGRFASLRELRARLEAVEGAPKFGAVRHLFSEPPTPRRSARERRGRLTV